MKLFPAHAVGLAPALMLLGHRSILTLLSSPAPASATLSALENDAPGPSADTTSTLAVASTVAASTVLGVAGGLDPANFSALACSGRGDDFEVLFAYVVQTQRGPPAAALLITYDLRCDTSGAATFPMPAGMMDPCDAAGMLRACKSWWMCNSAAEMVQRVKKAPRRQYRNGAWQRPQYDVCKELCACEPET